MHVQISATPQKLQAVAETLEEEQLWQYIPKYVAHRK